MAIIADWSGAINFTTNDARYGYKNIIRSRVRRESDYTCNIIEGSWLVPTVSEKIGFKIEIYGKYLFFIVRHPAKICRPQTSAARRQIILLAPPKHENSVRWNALQNVPLRALAPLSNPLLNASILVVVVV